MLKTPNKHLEFLTNQTSTNILAHHDGDVKTHKEGKGLVAGMIGFSPKCFETTNSLRLRIKWRNCIVEMTKQGKVG